MKLIQSKAHLVRTQLEIVAFLPNIPEKSWESPKICEKKCKRSTGLTKIALVRDNREWTEKRLARLKNLATKEVRTIDDNLTRQASVARDRRWIDSEESMGQDMTLNICETMNGTEVLVARDRRYMDPKERMNRDTTRLKICEIEMEKVIDQRPMREALVVQDKPRKETNDPKGRDTTRVKTCEIRKAKAIEDRPTREIPDKRDRTKEKPKEWMSWKRLKISDTRKVKASDAAEMLETRKMRNTSMSHVLRLLLMTMICMKTAKGDTTRPQIIDVTYTNANIRKVEITMEESDGSCNLQKWTPLHPRVESDKRYSEQPQEGWAKYISTLIRITLETKNN